ncbi:MAG: DegT/DnrJ/EryC1/StrS family aminotransferase [Oscillospiraceae bacterium]|nr:DegT/DnrJ/EryC1/StrS family aminotransferase [Oscillospiraceae bacterium]
MENNNAIYVTRSSIPSYEEYTEEIRDIWESRWLTNMGSKHIRLEGDLKSYLQTPYITLFANGHLALETVFTAMNLTGEVITTPFTFSSTTHAIVRCGLTPVFCDINPDDYTIDVSKIECLITPKTSAIVPVHVYGNICDVNSIQKIADKYNLKVIYDAAHAFAVEYKGVSSANFGDASTFSFHATKVFNTIEGGAVTSKNSGLIPILNRLKNFGIQDEENVTHIGGNAKMNEFQAAMGICNLRHIDAEIAKRRVIFDRYAERLCGIPGIKLSIPNGDIKSNYAYFPVVFDRYRYSRDEIVTKLRAENIFARKYFYPLVSDFECYRDRAGFDSSKTPVAKYIADSVLTLPLYGDLGADQADRICDIILEKD